MLTSSSCSNLPYNPKPRMTITRAARLGSGISKIRVTKKLGRSINCYWQKDSIERCEYILRPRAYSSERELVYIEYRNDTTTGFFLIETRYGPPIIEPEKWAN